MDACRQHSQSRRSPPRCEYESGDLKSQAPSRHNYAKLANKIGGWRKSSYDMNHSLVSAFDHLKCRTRVNPSSGQERGEGAHRDRGCHRVPQPVSVPVSDNRDSGYWARSLPRSEMSELGSFCQNLGDYPVDTTSHKC
jgi:hypothetical protein